MTWKVLVPFTGTAEERLARLEIMVYILWGALITKEVGF